ncbi:hydroxypyruvate isomerase family protein [Thioclava sp. FR2]|uniref:hydroxypyruvate isomerase family protein n=1 Tax=Thioclava sp. FR2 TaxID=3445780 RepID=UPI003EBC9FB1
MPRFAANLTLLFTEVPALQRAELAAQAGFDGVEILFPYDHPVAEWEKSVAGLPVALINTPPGNWGAGERGFAAVPGQEDRFRDGFLRAAEVANRLNAKRIHVMAGVARGPEAEQIFRENLAWACASAPGQMLTVEPINPDDMPGYFLNDFDQAARIIQDLSLPQVGLQYDVWHAARIHGNATAVWAAHRDQISHVQIAGFPGRHEPGGGGFDLTALCREIDEMEREVWIAAEYRPARATVHGLMWLQALKGRSRPIGA